MSKKILLGFCAGAEVLVTIPRRWKSDQLASVMVTELIREAKALPGLEDGSESASREARDHLQVASRNYQEALEQDSSHQRMNLLVLAAVTTGLVFRTCGQQELARQTAQNFLRLEAQRFQRD